MNLIEVNKSDLGECFAEIVPWNYKPKLGDEFKYVYPVYLDGEFPIMVKSKISRDEFERRCN